MSGFAIRAIAVSLACLVVTAPAALSAPRGGGGHGGGGGGGGGIARGGGGGGGAHFSAPAFRGGGGGAHFSAPAFHGGGAAIARPSFSGVRSFGGARTFSRPMVGSRHFGRPAFRGTGLSARTLHSGRVLHGSRFATRSFHGRSARFGSRTLSAHRLSSRGLATSRTLHGQRALAGRALDRRLATGTLGPRGARYAAFHRPGATVLGRTDWHHNWRRHRFIYYGWVGPLFWPYAYDDLFYDAFWGYGLYGPDYYYDDPFWAYGYGDIYGGLFSPYTYDDLAAWTVPYSSVGRVARRSGRYASRGAAAPTSIANRWAQMCGDDSRDVIGLPVDRIQEIVKPNDEQRAALDRLGDASVKAAQTIKAACPGDYALTPTGRLAAMEQRLQAIQQAIDIMRPPLESFYNLLTDEQKARLNAAGQRERAGGEQRSFAQDCSAATPATEWPTERINRLVRPTEAQRPSLERLHDAATKAADLLKSSCPSQDLATPPARLAAMAHRVEVMIKAVQSVRAAADAFYGSLTDEQKAQFNAIGQARAAR